MKFFKLNYFSNKFSQPHFISILICVFFFSCKKKETVITPEPYIGNIEILSTNTIKIINVGQDITSKVKLVVPSSSGEVTFHGFEIVENPTKTYSVNAKAFYKPWPGQVGSQLYSTFDTTMKINTSLTGQHIIKFYNADRLLKSDTIQVN